jgi:hypothetical protein
MRVFSPPALSLANAIILVFNPARPELEAGPCFMSELHPTHYSPARRRRSSRRRGPLLPAIKFILLGILWILAVVGALAYLRPHPLTNTDYMVASIGFALGLVYFWVAIEVLRRRRYILTAAYVLAGFGLINFPFGTIISVVLLSELVSRQQDFTK